MDRTLIEKTYRFMQWLLEHTAKFPRDYRHSLAAHLNDVVFRFFDGMLAATAVRDREARVQALSVELDTLRYYVRLSRDMRLISVKQYEYAAECMNELGRLLGGWMRSMRNRVGPQASTARAGDGESRAAHGKVLDAASPGE